MDFPPQANKILEIVEQHKDKLIHDREGVAANSPTGIYAQREDACGICLIGALALGQTAPSNHFSRSVRMAASNHVEATMYQIESMEAGYEGWNLTYLDMVAPDPKWFALGGYIAAMYCPKEAEED